MMFDCENVNKKNCGCCEYLYKVIRNSDDCFMEWKCKFDDLCERKKHCPNSERFVVVSAFKKVCKGWYESKKRSYMIQDTIDDKLLEFQYKYLEFNKKESAQTVCDALNNVAGDLE